MNNVKILAMNWDINAAAERIAKIQMPKKAVEIDNTAAKALMVIHGNDTPEKVDAWVESVKKMTKVQDIANHMAAMNWLGWKKDEPNMTANDQVYFKGYRKLQGWAYAEDSHGNTINLSNRDAMDLYSALD